MIRAANDLTDGEVAGVVGNGVETDLGCRQVGSVLVTDEPVMPRYMATSVSPSSVRLGPRRGGPYPRLRLDLGTKAAQGFDAYMLVVDQGLSFRQAAAQLGLSVTTTWRRCRWFGDWILPGFYGCRPGPIPPQRGTRACPRGRPFLPTVDGPGGPLYRGED